MGNRNFARFFGNPISVFTFHTANREFRSKASTCSMIVAAFRRSGW